MTKVDAMPKGPGLKQNTASSIEMRAVRGMVFFPDFREILTVPGLVSCPTSNYR